MATLSAAPTAKAPPLPYLTPPRFAAAFGVVVLHVWLNWFGEPSLPGFFRAGYLGVGFFFVLSGFIIAYAHGDRAFSNGSFWRARFLRIYPAYLLGLLVAFYKVPKLVHLYRGTGDYGSLVLDPLSHLLLLHSWSQKYYMSWNYPGWTLGVEALFYALFPFVLPWVKRLSAPDAWALALVCWGLAFVRFVFPSESWFMTRHPIGRTPEFVFGIALWAGYRAMTPETRGRLAKPLTLASLAAAVFFYAAHDLFPAGALDGGVLAPVWGGLVLGLACWPVAERPSRTLKIATLLGDASYSMYILQAGVIAMVGFVTTRVGFLNEHRPLGAALAAVAVLAAGLASHRYLEEPLRQRFRGWLVREPVGVGYSK